MRRIALVLFFIYHIPVAIAQNVGIGTTTPLTRLHVSGPDANIATFTGGNLLSVTLAEGGNNRGYIGSFYGNPEDVDFGTHASNATGKLHLTTNGIFPRLTITPTGNIGLNQPNPTVPLNFPDQLGTKISLWGTGATHYGMGIQAFLFQLYSEGPSSDIAFGYGSSSNFTENMRVKGNGNVGIGLPAPVQKLDINGALRIGTTANNVAGTIRFNPANNDFEGYDGSAWKSLTANNAPPIQSEPNDDPNAHINDLLGNSVKIIGDIAFAGAPYYDVGSSINQGVVQIYQKSILTNKFELKQTLQAPGGVIGDQFGFSVDAAWISGSCGEEYTTAYLVVGAPGRSAARGAVYLFRYDYPSDQFIYVSGPYSPADISPGDRFGEAIAMDVNVERLIIGAPEKTVNGASSQGRAYLVDLTNTPNPCTQYALTGFAFVRSLNIRGNAAGSRFGSAVAINTETGEDLYAVGAANRTLSTGVNQGAVYMFRLSDPVPPDWYDSIAVAEDGNAGDFFGSSIAFQKETGLLAVGAPFKENGVATGQGAVYFFKDTADAANTRWWKQAFKITAPDGTTGDNFGIDVEWQSPLLLIGSSGRDDIATDAGAVYIYKGIPYTDLGFRYQTKITDASPQASSSMGKQISFSANNYILGIPQWDITGKSDAGKVMFGYFYY